MIKSTFLKTDATSICYATRRSAVYEKIYKRLLKNIKFDMDGDSDDFRRTVEINFPVLCGQQWKILQTVGHGNSRRLEDAPEEGRWTIRKVKE